MVVLKLKKVEVRHLEKFIGHCAFQAISGNIDILQERKVLHAFRKRACKIAAGCCPEQKHQIVLAY